MTDREDWQSEKTALLRVIEQERAALALQRQQLSEQLHLQDQYRASQTDAFVEQLVVLLQEQQKNSSVLPQSSESLKGVMDYSLVQLAQRLETAVTVLAEDIPQSVSAFAAPITESRSAHALQEVRDVARQLRAFGRTS